MVFSYSCSSGKAEDLLFKSNQQLKDQFNNTPLASIIWDLDFNILEWNNSAERIFGYKAEEVIGKSNKDLLTPPYLLEEMKRLRETSFIQNNSFRQTNENITKNGKIIICDWYSVTLKDTENNIIGAACLVDDITERIALDEMMIQNEKMMSIGGLAAGMAHEIRNPLGSIRGTAEILRDAFPPEDRYSEFTQILINEVDRLNQVLEDFLRFAQPEKGEQPCFLPDIILQEVL